jgi:hypothetical protein
MPAADLYVRYLLAAGLAQNISLRLIVFVNNTNDPEGFEQRVFQTFRSELRDRGELAFSRSDARHHFSEVAYGYLSGENGRRFRMFPCLGSIGPARVLSAVTTVFIRAPSGALIRSRKCGGCTGSTQYWHARSFYFMNTRACRGTAKTVK